MNGGEQSVSVKEAEARAAIGRRIVYWALAAVTALGVVAVLMAGLASLEKLAGVKDILGMLLPVIGACVKGDYVGSRLFPRRRWEKEARRTASSFTPRPPCRKIGA